MRYIIYSFVVLALTAFNARAQQFLTGKIYEKGGQDSLISVSIHNITAQRYDLSEIDGTYKIQCAPGDHVAFSSVGYRPDTITITASLLSAICIVYMEIRPVTLKAARVGELSNYQLDSIDRHREYGWIYDRSATPRFDPNRGGDGVGVQMNIFRNTSTPAKQRERLEKRLVKEEQDFYVNFRYNKDYVAKITHLQGDSLKAFMKKYRPSYEYCRKAATVDILVYINDCYKLFMKAE
jgi:hypothetical protein